MFVCYVYSWTGSSTAAKVKIIGYYYAQSIHFCRSSCFQSTVAETSGRTPAEFHATETIRVLAKNNSDLTPQELSCLERTRIEYCKGLCSHPCNRIFPQNTSLLLAYLYSFISENQMDIIISHLNFNCIMGKLESPQLQAKNWQ